MAFDSSANRLLIACKGSPSYEKENPYKGFRAVYYFDLETMQLYDKPVYLVDLRNIECLQGPG